jgi:hypothetical protein
VFAAVELVSPDRTDRAVLLSLSDYGTGSAWSVYESSTSSSGVAFEYRGPLRLLPSDGSMTAAGKEEATRDGYSTRCARKRWRCPQRLACDFLVDHEAKGKIDVNCAELTVSFSSGQYGSSHL